MNKAFEVTTSKIEKIGHPSFRVGDMVKVHRRVKEGNKERIQIIEGEIIAHKHGTQPGATITIRRTTLGVSVELILPIYSPHTEKIEIIKRQKVRRAKLYYLRKTIGKKSKLKENIEATKRIREVGDRKNKKAKDREKEGKNQEEQVANKKDTAKEGKSEKKEEVGD